MVSVVSVLQVLVVKMVLSRKAAEAAGIQLPEFPKQMGGLDSIARAGAPLQLQDHPKKDSDFDSESDSDLDFQDTGSPMRIGTQATEAPTELAPAKPAEEALLGCGWARRTELSPTREGLNPMMSRNPSTRHHHKMRMVMTQCGIEPCAAMPKAGSHTVWISPILILIFCQMSHLQVRSCRGVHQAGENPKLPVPRRKRQETKSAPAAAPAAARF